MKKLYIVVFAIVLLLAGCQQTTIDETKEKDAIDKVIVEEASDNTGSIVVDNQNDEVVVIEDQQVLEIHEWTDTDEAQLQEFIEMSNALSLKEAKLLLDEKMMDASQMMADRYLEYYEQRLTEALTVISDNFFVGTVQEDLASVFNYGHFSREQLQKIESLETINMIDPLYDIGYKVETTEGMYYPIVDYSVLYQYEDKVTSGVQKYLRLMKRQSDIMAYSDAAIVVPWSELGDRLLVAEELLNEELPDAMAERVKMEFEWGMQSFVFGTNNTPVFNYEDKTISDPEILASFNKVAENGGVIIKRIMNGYLEVLEEENYIGTDKVYETLNELMKDMLN